MKLNLPAVPIIKTETIISDATEPTGSSSRSTVEGVNLAEDLSLTEDEITAEAEYFKNVVDCNFTALKVRQSSDLGNYYATLLYY